MSKSAKLREMLKSNNVINIIGAHDALSAKLGELAGFDAVWASGLGISASYAVPDANILTMNDYLNSAIAMNDATSIPVIADCDTGYGNSSNVMRMVQKYESANIAAVCIEDKKFPKTNSLLKDAKQELASIAEFVGKIMAAKSMQKTKDFMVIARVEALIAGLGHKEALKRAKAYANAGADAILIHSKSNTPDEILQFVELWKNYAPLVIVPTNYPNLTLKKAGDLGIKMVVYANQGLRASIPAIKSVFSQIIKDGSTINIEDKICSVKEIFELQGMLKLKELEKYYLKHEYDDLTVVIPAAGEHKREATLSDLISGIPLTMLDINGKPLLQRIVDTLKLVGLSKIFVVGGYNIDKIAVEGADIIENKDYHKTGITESIMHASTRINGRMLIAYADIIFEKSIIKRLLESPHDITIVVSRFSEDLSKPDSDKVIATNLHMSTGAGRILSFEQSNPVKKIGKKFTQPHYEFTGIALFSHEGTEIFKKEYEAAKKLNTAPFYETSEFSKASFTDMLQYLIDKGHRVEILEIASGWSEIKTFDDYKNITLSIKSAEF